jgi:hypothetical protein
VQQPLEITHRRFFQQPRERWFNVSNGAARVAE